MSNEPLIRLCAGIELLVLDVDGVLTDGSIIYSDRGEEIKAFHVRDGSGLKIWTTLGKKAGLITGRKSEVIVSGGENVAPAEVEAWLRRDPLILYRAELIAAGLVTDAEADRIIDEARAGAKAAAAAAAVAPWPSADQDFMAATFA